MMFSNLRVLNLSHNMISELRWVPQNLEELYLTGNRISSVALQGGIQDKLIHIALAYNQVDDKGLERLLF